MRKSGLQVPQNLNLSVKLKSRGLGHPVHILHEIFAFSRGRAVKFSFLDLIFPPCTYIYTYVSFSIFSFTVQLEFGVRMSNMNCSETKIQTRAKLVQKCRLNVIIYR